MAWMSSLDETPYKVVGVAPPCLDDNFSFPFGFFDVASQSRDCGAGMVLRIVVDHHFHLNMRAGRGSNTRAELVALWGLLHFALVRGISLTHIFCDSTCIIDWACERSILRPILLHHWFRGPET